MSDLEEQERDRQQRRKMAAPVLISAVVVCWLLLQLAVWLVPLPVAVKVVCTIIVLSLAAALLWMLRERINEIRSGEEDDLSKY